MQKEICICAAVIVEDGSIMRGQRHGDCMVALRSRNKPIKRNDRSAQGFITSTGRYVDRQEGYKLQIDAGIKSANKDGYVTGTLFSEDLY